MPKVLPKAEAGAIAPNEKMGGVATVGPPKGFWTAVVGVGPPYTGWLARVPKREAVGLPNIPELEPKGPVFEEAD